MSQETLNIIIGALIGFIPSAILALVTLRFQMYQKERERQWQIEDLRRIRNKEVTETRLNQIEKFVVEIFNTIQYIETIGEKAFIDENSYQRFIEVKVIKANELNSLLVFANSLQNEELLKCIQDLVENTNQILNLFYNVKNIQSKNGCLSPYDIQNFEGTLSLYSRKVKSISKYAIRTVDWIRRQVY